MQPEIGWNLGRQVQCLSGESCHIGFQSTTLGDDRVQWMEGLGTRKARRMLRSCESHVKDLPHASGCSHTETPVRVLVPGTWPKRVTQCDFVRIVNSKPHLSDAAPRPHLTPTGKLTFCARAHCPTMLWQGFNGMVMSGIGRNKLRPWMTSPMTDSTT